MTDTSNETPHTQLTDDVVDVFLTLLTNGKVTQDRVGPHGDLLADFPYLARRTTRDLSSCVRLDGPTALSSLTSFVGERS